MVESKQFEHKYVKSRGKESDDSMKAFLILEDGTVFEGKSIGSTREVISEIVLIRR